MTASYRLHRNGALRTGRKRPPKPGPAQVVRVNRAVRAAAMKIAQGDGRRIEIRDETTPDVVRDLTVDLGLGLVRMHERHHRIEDVFREGGAGSVQPV